MYIKTQLMIYRKILSSRKIKLKSQKINYRILIIRIDGDLFSIKYLTKWINQMKSINDNKDLFK